MPTEELEHQLRRTLARAAAALPDPQQARQRLLQRDYHPRGSHRMAAGLTAALAVAAAAVVAWTALLAGHPGRHQPSAQLAAWTVVKQANGTIRVTVRNLRDPAGLQAELRADGVPASITFAGQANPACRPYPHGSRIQDLLATVAQPVAPPHPARGGTIVVIHPSALPHGAGLQLDARFAPNPHHGAGRLIQISGALVHASQQCTGS
jgi:hypothetical protein